MAVVKNRQTAILITIILFTPFLYLIFQGLDKPYTSYFDQDIIIIYNALLLNDNLEQAYFDHTGYILILVSSWFIEVLAAIGILPYTGLRALQESSNFHNDLQTFIVPFRLLAASLTAMTLLFSYKIIHIFSGSKYLALIFTLILCFSEGIAYQTLVIRTESLSFLLFLISVYFQSKIFFCESNFNKLILYSTISGIFLSLAMLTKTQVIALILLLPILFYVLLYYKNKTNSSSLNITNNTHLKRLLIFQAVFVTITSLVLIKHLLKRDGVEIYHGILIMYSLVACIALYKASKLKPKVFILIISSIVTGGFIGLYFSLFHYNYRTILFTIDFLDNMRRFSEQEVIRETNSGISIFEIIKQSFIYIDNIIFRYFSLDAIKNRAFHIIEISVLLSIGYSIYTKSYKLAGILTAFLAFSLIQEILFSFRYLRPQYFIYFEVWLLAALAIFYQQKTKNNDLFIKYVIGFFCACYVFINMQLIMKKDYVPIQNMSTVCSVSKAYTQGIYPQYKSHCK